MWEIITTIRNTLLWIITGIPEAIINILSSRHQPRSLEEQIVDKSRRQGSMIQSQQDRLIYHVRKDKEQSLKSREKDALLEKKDKKIKALEARIRSLEREIFELRSRLKHRR